MPQTKSSRSLTSFRRQFVALGVGKGLLFWYAIEKLFQTHIGITPAQIVLIGVLAQGSKVVFELPTSIFADRWNRRNILLLAQLSMLICCVILGVSSSILVYVVGILFWSLSDALTSGVYEAFAYDSIQAAGYKVHFQKIYTRMKSGELLSMAIAGVGAGLLSLHFSLRLSFFLSIISTLVCSALLYSLPEPAIERTKARHANWLGHIGEATKILMTRKLRWPAGIYILFMGFLSIWYEYYQLLGVDIKLTPVLFGSLISVLTIGMMVGAEIAHKKPGSRMTIVTVWATLLLTHLVGLRFRNAWMVFASLFVTFVALMLLEIYLEVYIQEVISSEHRATVFSLASTLGYATFFVFALVFGLVLNHVGIRWALTITSLPLLLLGVIDCFRAIPWATNKVAKVVEFGEVREK